MAIPRAIFGGRGDAHTLAVDEALGLLASYSMITLTPDEVSMHRLVQAVILARPGLKDEGSAFGGESPLTTAAGWLDDAIPSDPDTNAAGWPLLRALIPHAESLDKHFATGNRPQDFGPDPERIRGIPDSQGQYDQARHCASPHL